MSFTAYTFLLVASLALIVAFVAHWASEALPAGVAL